MIVNKHLWCSVACLPNEPIEREISLSNKAALSQSELIRKFCISYDVCKRCFILLFAVKEKQTRIYFTFQRCSFKKNMARDLDDD